MSKDKTLFDWENPEHCEAYTHKNGFEFDWRGCCCMCENQVKIVSHPWCDGKYMDNVIAYGCAAMLHPALRTESPRVSLSHQHGYCELFTWKKIHKRAV